jgi:DNA-binding HxlR family transcriptional regulator/peroxiredoxin
MALRTPRQRDADCGIAQAVAAVGDWWSLLILREVARGRLRFDDLHGELAISRKVLTERLKHLVARGVLTREPYQHGPTRYDYRLTAAGRGLLPVLVALQDWSDRWLLGDGTVTGTVTGAAAARVHGLVGARVPPLSLPASAGGHAGGHAGGEVDVAGEAAATILFCYPATGTPGQLPPGWSAIPGAAGCTLENRLFQAAASDCAAAGVAIRGVSTQRPDEQRAFAEAEGISFPLLSDADLRLAAALRLPTFRAGQVLRLRRTILVLDAGRTVAAVTFPVTDVATAVAGAVTAAKAAARATVGG